MHKIVTEIFCDIFIPFLNDKVNVLFQQSNFDELILLISNAYYYILYICM